MIVLVNSPKEGFKAGTRPINCKESLSHSSSSSSSSSFLSFFLSFFLLLFFQREGGDVERKKNESCMKRKVTGLRTSPFWESIAFLLLL
jgi:hypothetical protein